MTNQEFEKIVNAKIERIQRVMIAKNVDYARNGDKLHNFKAAAEMDGTSPEKAAKGMLLKHWQSIRDMIDDLDKGVFPPIPHWQEKLDDAVNYLILLEALVLERYRKHG